MSQGEHAELSDLPPSALLVYRVLEESQPLTKQEICAESYLCASTAGNALSELIDVGVVDYNYSTADARRRVYYLEH
ncbi:helix-turn-helix domain-containing protein [Haloarcula sp. CBA1127]|uniref:MarR family transcriptional regulator n=1 Tax=Haloarcula sp. CBA1127 TaxID=1765055 RepID=UPI00073F6045|nr:helix-turn-helix domain-containing protein [Haloarcula sp. CBA1127]